MSFSAGHFSKTWQGVPQEHLYLPEAGKVWVDTARTTLASPGDPVGAVEDQSGQHYAEQGTTANKPTLKEDANGNRYLEFVPNEDFLEVDVTTTKATKVSTIPGVGAWSGEVEPGLKGRSKARIQSTTAAALFAGGSQTGATRSDWARRLDQRGKDVADSVTSFKKYFRSEPLVDYEAHAQDTSQVTDMSLMFISSNLSDFSAGGWDTSSVTNMDSIFRNTSLSDLSGLENWDTSSVTNMNAMFGGTAGANISDISPLKGWDTSNVTNMNGMFGNNSVSDPSPISGWDVAAVTDFSNFLTGTTLDSAKTGAMLDGWTDGSPNTAADLQSGVTLGIQNADYSQMNASGQDAVGALAADSNWTINAANLPLLNEYSGAAAAYSLRKLRAGYSGDCIRVRRSSDNAEQDIGFSGGTLDETALTNFVGSGDGFVQTWYDQSSAGNDGTQTTQSEQAQIVSSGSVLTRNGEPALSFSNDMLDTTYNLFNYTAFSLFAVVYSGTGISNSQAFLSSRKDSDKKEINFRIRSDALELSQFDGNDADNATVAISTSTQYLADAHYDGAFKIAKQNNSLTIGNSDPLYSHSVKMGIGARNNTGGDDQFLEGEIQELIVYDKDNITNRGGINKNINNHYSIF